LPLLGTDNEARSSVQDTLLLLETRGLDELSRDDFSHNLDVASVIVFCAKNKLRLPNTLARSLLSSSEFYPEDLEAEIESDKSLSAPCLEVLENHPRLLQRFAAVSMTGLIRERLARLHPTYLDYSQTPPQLSADDLSYFKELKRYEVLVWCHALDAIPVEILVSLCRRTPQIFDVVVAFLNEEHPLLEEELYAKKLAERLADDQHLWQSARTYQAAAFVQACSFSSYPVSLYAKVAKFALGKHLAYLWDEPSRDPRTLDEIWYSLADDTQADVVESLSPVLLDNDPTPAQKDVCDRFLRESPQSGKSALRVLNAPYNSPLKDAARRRLSTMTLSQRAVLKLLLPDTEAPFDHIVASLKTL
jgi:hypothetical protein